MLGERGGGQRTLTVEKTMLKAAQSTAFYTVFSTVSGLWPKSAKSTLFVCFAV